jgi:flagellin-specific chaperone FliS
MALSLPVIAVLGFLYMGWFSDQVKGLIDVRLTSVVTPLQAQLDRETSARQSLSAMIGQFSTDLAVLKLSTDKDSGTSAKQIDELSNKMDKLYDQMSQVLTQVSALTALSNARDTPKS